MFGPERHDNLADALPVPAGGVVMDLGCGSGSTLAALAARLDGESRLIGVEIESPEFVGDLAADERVEAVVADLGEALPFEDASVDAAVCQNVVECLRDPQTLLSEVARVLTPGGHLLLGHTDFDTLVFSSNDLALTRRLVHSFCDTVQPWMTVADGTVGRHLLTLSRRSPLEVVRTFAWVGQCTSIEDGNPADVALQLVAQNGRRDPELAPHIDAWLADLHAQAERGEFLYSVNDYAVSLRKASA